MLLWINGMILYLLLAVATYTVYTVCYTNSELCNIYVHKNLFY